MTEHLRPPHPGCKECARRLVHLARNTRDLGNAKSKLVRAQRYDEPDQLQRLLEHIEQIKAHHVATIEIYNQHYDTSHSSFADADQPFAKSPSHRLTADDVTEIKQLLSEGVPRKDIAEAFGVSKSTIVNIARTSGHGERRPQPAPEEDGPLPLVLDQPWAVDALCSQTDPEAFFPEKGGSTRDAKAVCGRCTVAAECLDYALANQERYGIWGGMSERERRRLATQLQQATQENTTPEEGTAA